MNPRPPVRAGGFYTDPKPYRRRSGTRWWSRRWAVEFWTDDGDHNFTRFFTYRSAARWAEAHMGARWMVGGQVGPEPVRYDLFRLQDPMVVTEPVEPPVTPRGGISYVDPPDSVPFRLVDVPAREPLDQAAIEMDLLIAGESYVRQPRRCPVCLHPAHDGECGHDRLLNRPDFGPEECELCPLPRGHAGRCEGEPT